MFLCALTACKDSEKKENSTESSVENTLEKQEDAIISEVEAKKGTILFFGNSLTAGMGLAPEESFPALIQKKIDSLDLPYTVVNAGLSGETTAAGKNRLDWVLDQPVAVFVLELGANDGLRGIPLSETRANLQEIIDKVRAKSENTDIILAGMQLPPNLGVEYTEEFKNIFPELAVKNEVKLIPFLLKDVAAIPELNQNDGIHPTAEGQKIVAGNVWEVLNGLLHQ
ncbi:arylesterase [Robertkochia solimangrovi]|nr:arylesterase [Robertkochia solimangrovi]